MGNSIFLGLVQNTALLVALGLIYDLIRGMSFIPNKYVKQVLMGLVTGSIGIALMGTPWVLSEGVIFDTRSVLLSVSGLFFGTIPTVIGMLMLGIMRISMGGDGVLMGVAVVIVTGTTGIVWRHVRRDKLGDLSLGELYLFGLFVHIFMMACTILLPDASRMHTISKIGIPVLLIYPVGEMLLGWMLTAGEKHRLTLLALAKREKSFKGLFDTVDEAIFVQNLKGELLDVNKGATKMYGFSREQIIGKSPDFLAAPGLNNIEEFKRRVHNAIEGETQEFESWGIRSNGEIFPQVLKLYKGTFYDQDAIIGMAQDLTERKKAEQELIEAKEKAEEANKLKSSFLANMSHELRTPMIGIIGYSEMMMESEHNDETKRIGSIIFNSASRLMQTLNLILDLSRIESGKTELNYTTVEIIGLINEVVDRFESAARFKGLSIRVNTGFSDLFMQMDVRLFDQILCNLIDNGIKFTHKGGLAISAFEEVILDRKWLVVEVKDTGIGISAEDQKIIWEEFRQASEGWGRGYEGTGLGLSLTKKFISKMGGTINVSSALGFGSTFSFRLPLDREAGEHKSLNSDLVESSSQEGENVVTMREKQNIIIIDDDEVTIDVARAFLRENYIVDSAVTIQEALSLIEKNQYSLILLDINLGKGVTGFQVLDALKKLPNYQNIPVIAVTAYAMVGDREIFLKAGCSDYISKPFTRQALVHACDKATGITVS
ncbi:hypothetical protein MASR1M107_00470 [Ignavibacteriales bacterium]